MTDSTTEKAGNSDLPTVQKLEQMRQRMLEELRKYMSLLWQLGGRIIKRYDAGLPDRRHRGDRSLSDIIVGTNNEAIVHCGEGVDYVCILF